MGHNEEMIKILAEEFGVPTINRETHVWFFRTQSGIYYPDFYLNGYIALGWDLISDKLLSDKHITIQARKEEVSKLYPEEQRPGLILGQMETFYNKMQVNDWVVIPNYGGKKVAIGLIGDIANSILHAITEDEYVQCEYKHKRSVHWLKEVDLSTDVYLSKILRAQQTISDITVHSEMVYRNLHPCYISSNAIHLTLQKTTYSEYGIKDNVTLQYAIIKIEQILSEHFDTEDDSASIKIKTAVGSPGFIEILLPYIPVSAITAVCIFKTLLGKAKSKNGETTTGILAIISKANELSNDYWTRKKTKAEISQIEASTRKINAEVAQQESAKSKLDAETAKIQAETDSIQIANRNSLAVVEKVTNYCDELKNAAENSGIRVARQLEEIARDKDVV